MRNLTILQNADLKNFFDQIGNLRSRNEICLLQPSSSHIFKN